MTNISAIKNPFANLSVKRDAEDGPVESKPMETKMPLTYIGETQKKRKVRPEQKAKIKEVQSGASGIKGRPEEADEEGFTEVRRGKIIDRDYIDEKFPNENYKPVQKGGEKTHHFMPRGKKRIFDRHSGTGRGKEISKGGAGGKTIWGNADQIARENVIDYMAAAEEEIYSAKDENYFSYALKTKPLETPETKTGAEKVEEIPPTEEIPPETLPEHLDSKKEEKRKRKKGALEEKIEEGERFERPENGLSYKEYLEQLKKKNENLNKEIKTLERKDAVVLEVTPKQSEDMEYQQWMDAQHLKKKKDKVKGKKIDSAEEELNRIVGQQFTLTDEYSAQQKYAGKRYTH